ncbi:hypothetical protein [Halopelagius longus]|uniref:Uncharacterized protein n=1 Tax=Halopelagius longus TaxID=1236180 RepID=A0A1H1G738_9EURY|nr:hypothetical protein [Halopelagius longus]SDR09074.1 hypothetical protein SAMN05216278_3567 [Halopelagius longus]
MPSPLRSGVRVALERPRALALVGFAVVVETALRVAAGFVHPLASLLLPPVVVVPLLGAGLPAVEAALADSDAGSPWNLGRRFRTVGTRLVAAATAGHAAAVVLGATLFLVVDTPIRYAAYALGAEPFHSAVVYVAPFVGVTVGTGLAWGLLVPAVVRLADGDAAVPAVRTAVGVALGAPRRTATVLALHAAGLLVVGVCVLTAVEYSGDFRAVRAFLAVGGVLGAAAATLSVTFLYPIHVAFAASDAAPRRREIPVRRLGLVVLLLSGLLCGAAAVRVTETRPTADARPLPDDPTAAYATAFENTDATSYEVTYVETERGRPFLVRTAVDRPDRQFYSESNFSGGYQYADAGVGYTSVLWADFLRLGTRDIDGRTAAVEPAFWSYDRAVRLDGVFGIPRPGTGEWRAVERGDGVLVLELTGGDEVYSALYGFELENATYETARIRMRVDTERGVVTGGDARLRATESEFGSDVRVRTRYSVRTGEDVDVRRPTALGSRTLGEWVWKLFAY